MSPLKIGQSQAKGTPNNVISKLNAAAVFAMAGPLVRARLVDLGLQFPPPPQQQ
jgi:hypothetical protein